MVIKSLHAKHKILSVSNESYNTRGTIVGIGGKIIG